MKPEHQYVNEELEHLVKEAWQQHQQFQSSGFLVESSQPILFFGDLSAYGRSEPRVITVGLNPSVKEFIEDKKPVERFPSRDHNWSVSTVNPTVYIQCLSEYFSDSKNPYRKWFKHFKLTLKEMDTSFYGPQPNKEFPIDPPPNTALHTDLISTLATKHKLNDLLEKALADKGAPLWRCLIRYLRPHIILAIVGKDRCRLITVKQIGEWQTILKVRKKMDETGSLKKRETSYLVEACKIEVSENCKPLLVSCDSTRSPLGIYPAAKSELGRRILKAYLGNPQACWGEWYD